MLHNATDGKQEGSNWTCARASRNGFTEDPLFSFHIVSTEWPAELVATKGAVLRENTTGPWSFHNALLAQKTVMFVCTHAVSS